MPFVVQEMNYDVVEKWMNMAIGADGTNISVSFRLEDTPTEPADTLEKQAKRKAMEILEEALKAL